MDKGKEVEHHLPELPDLPDLRKSFVKSKKHTATLIIIPFVIILFLGLLIAHQQNIEKLKNENQELLDEIYKLQEQNIFYKKAYEVTLDDIKTLSKVYGGEEQYEELAERLRQQELETVGKKDQAELHILKNSAVWSQYVDLGIINTSCLELSVVDTIQEEVLVSINVSPIDGLSDMSVYLDANFLSEVLVNGEMYKFSVALPKGTHELGLVSKQGQLRLNSITFDAVSIDGEKAVADSGKAWQVFDCRDAVSGGDLSEPGALRILFDKK